MHISNEFLDCARLFEKQTVLADILFKRRIHSSKRFGYIAHPLGRIFRLHGQILQSNQIFNQLLRTRILDINAQRCRCIVVFQILYIRFDVSKRRDRIINRRLRLIFHTRSRKQVINPTDSARQRRNQQATHIRRQRVKVVLQYAHLISI